MNEVKLLPCPFCGCEDVGLKQSMDGKIVGVCCGNVNCGSVTTFAGFVNDECDAWNRRHTPPNTPLTLEELRGMDGEPVFVVELFGAEPGRYWCVMDGKYAAIPGCDHFWHELTKYGKTWLAYRRKPEEGENGNQQMGRGL